MREKPGHFTMPGATVNNGHSWFITTVLVNSLYFAWPHFFGGIFTSKSADTAQRNTVIMPLYVLPLALIFFAGCAALLIVPGLKNGDLALLTAVRVTFPPWLLGVIGGAGALTAMVPSAIHILTASTLVAKNVYRPMFARDMSEERVRRVAQMSVAAVTIVALGLSIHSSTTLVGLLLLAYSGVCQFAPGIVLGIYSSRVNAAGVLTGLVAGLSIAGYLIFTQNDPIWGLNAGFVGLVVNTILVVAVSLMTAPKPSGFDFTAA